MPYQEPQALNGTAQFHELFGAPILPKPEIPSPERCALRVSLLQEELNELQQAIDDGDLVEIADALGDIQYVLAGAVHEFGLSDRFADIFAEIQRSNMSKACATLEEAEQTVEHYKTHKAEEAYIVEKNGEYLVHRAGDDKVLKSVNYSSADLSSFVL
ncbi:MAG: nucleoside triphosphate pyrophosphohydrolase family protein [Candidatus Peribacteria bacterium]|nr:MAG: nucleoside triphosphate pyrophosphohydrolase family protein [Candidatus Peribacteria bacterium]